MSVHDTILGHLIGWGLPRRHEDAATEGLVFLLQRHPEVYRRFVALLQAAQPELPDDLRFATQESFASAGRPELCGRDGDGVRVFVESKFGAALTDNQPVSYLERLAAGPAASLLLFIVPEWRRLYLWRELLERLRAAQIGLREQGPQLVEIAGRSHDQRLHVLSWTAVFKALGDGAGAEARANLEQLAGVCRIADDSDSRPLLREELSDPQVPARLIQYVNIVRGVLDKGAADVFRAVSRSNTSYWYALGQKIQFTGEKAPVAWLGVDLLRWRKYETGPIWLTFDWNFGQAKHVKDRLQAWANEQQRVLCDVDDGVMLGIHLLAGREPPAVIEDVIGQLRTIGAMIRGGPAQAP